jgi:hypothetical protein
MLMANIAGVFERNELKENEAVDYVICNHVSLVVMHR